nr:CDGSH iron-sulfur domain-containing protein 2 [Zonotrichia albicollis]
MDRDLAGGLKHGLFLFLTGQRQHLNRVKPKNLFLGTCHIQKSEQERRVSGGDFCGRSVLRSPGSGARLGRVTHAGPQARPSDSISPVTRRKEHSPQKVEVEKVIKLLLQHPGAVPKAGLNPALSPVSEWLRLLPFLGVLALLGYLAVRPFLPKKKQQKDSLINLKIQKENPKVVNEINIEDLCLTKAYCRCWRSKTFPVCDGSHNKHNELTGDNVGPLILKKKEV